jgi:putative Holliday junction resolvase
MLIGGEAMGNEESGRAQAPPRYLGLDIGTKRIGVAVSDELGLLARPVMTLERKRNPKEDLRSLARLCRKYDCVAIVAGNPLHLSGEMSAQGERARKFAGELAALAALPLHLWDERLTSREAHAILYEAGLPRQEHGAVVDQVAATLILQGFLDAQRAFDPALAADTVMKLGDVAGFEDEELEVGGAAAEG